MSLRGTEERYKGAKGASRRHVRRRDGRSSGEAEVAFPRMRFRGEDRPRKATIGARRGRRVRALKLHVLLGQEGRRDRATPDLEPGRLDPAPDRLDQLQDHRQRLHRGRRFGSAGAAVQALLRQREADLHRPTYNTGNDFVYPSNFTDPLKSYLIRTGQIDDDGNRVDHQSDSEG